MYISLLYVVLIVAFGIIWLSPNQGLFSRRPAAIYYARFWTLYRIFLYIATLLPPLGFYVGYCVHTSLIVLGTGFVKNYIVYRAFEIEASWWHGYSEDSQVITFFDYIFGKDRDDSVSIKDQVSIETPLQGIELSPAAAEAMATADVGLRVRKKVPLLDFTKLRILGSRMLGSGSSARVYEGRFRKNPCAVKILYTVEILPEEIRRCCEEASLLYSLQDRSSANVVGVLGVAILPPSLCVVLEICSEGSLFDVLHAMVQSTHCRASQAARTSITLWEFKHCLNWGQKLELALGAALGVAAISTAFPGLSHNDIKVEYNARADQCCSTYLNMLPFPERKFSRKPKSRRRALRG